MSSPVSSSCGSSSLLPFFGEEEEGEFSNINSPVSERVILKSGSSVQSVTTSQSQNEQFLRRFPQYTEIRLPPSCFSLEPAAASFAGARVQEFNRERELVESRSISITRDNLIPESREITIQGMFQNLARNAAFEDPRAQVYVQNQQKSSS